MLVFDRTQFDVIRAIELIEIGYKNLSSSQKEEWDKGLKGCYTYNDLNRVEKEVERLSTILNQNGYRIDTDTKTDWKTNDKLTDKDVRRYLKNIDALKNASLIFPETPPAPLNYKPYNYANDIENILFDINVIIGWMLTSFIYSNQYYSAQPYEDMAGFEFRDYPIWNDLLKFTWSELTRYTWGELKSEIIPER